MDTKDLDLLGIISFDGITRNGLHLHPDGKHLIYPMGNKVSIKNLSKDGGGRNNAFLTGHQNIISALCISPCAKLLASGQLNHHGFKAMVIIWDYEERRMKSSYEIHKVRVEDLCFTRESDYLISLGGKDDGRIIVWDVGKGEPLCGSLGSNDTSGNAFAIARTNLDPRCFVTVGDGTFKVWRILPESRRVCGENVKIGKLRRTINCATVDRRDKYVYCGTSSGDLIKARLNISEHTEARKSPVMVGCYSKISNTRSRSTSRTDGEGDLYAGGIRILIALSTEKLIVAAGDGTVELISIKEEAVTLARNTKQAIGSQSTVLPRILAHRATKVCSPVTSMSLYKEQTVFVGTVSCEIYEIELSSFHTRSLLTCHTSAIYDIAFPRDHSEIFATAGRNDVRVWRLKTQKELLRIIVPNFVCACLCFSDEGRIILSGWNDGAIRGFSLLGGKKIFAISNAHAKAVSAIVRTNDGAKIISGGCDGQVRIWNAKSEAKGLLNVLKEHRGPVTCLRISRKDLYLISSSTDGTCIVWDVMTLSRKYVLMGSTMYMGVCFTPCGVQILSCGTDRKIAYWESWDGSLVREIEGSSIGTLNCIDISPNGRYFLTGSNDFTLKLWDYRTARVLGLGLTHAGAISACRFSPDSKYIVTASVDGAIMLWNYPSDPIDPIDPTENDFVLSDSRISSGNLCSRQNSESTYNEAQTTSGDIIKGQKGANSDSSKSVCHNAKELESR